MLFLCIYSLEENFNEMRTNIDIDENLLEEYRNLTGFKTKKEAVKQALKHAIKMEKRKKLAGLAGKVTWEGSLEQMRSYDKWEDAL